MEEIEIRMELNQLSDEIMAIKENQSRITQKLYQLEEEFLKKPNSMIFSESFLARAFAVWGHYLVVQLIIGIPIVILMKIIS